MNEEHTPFDSSDPLRGTPLTISERWGCLCLGLFSVWMAIAAVWKTVDILLSFF